MNSQDRPFRSGRANFVSICRVILWFTAVYSGSVAVTTHVLLNILPLTDGFVHTQVTSLYVTMCVHAAVSSLALLAILLLRRKSVTSPAAPRTLLVAGIIFLPISLDLIVGIFFPLPDEKTTVLQPHPSRGWSQRPNSTGDYFGMPAHINSLGLRGEDFPVNKPSGEFRILFVGDSITLGLGLAEEDTFVRRIEPLLSESVDGLRLRTINAGCSGYTTWQVADYLEKEGLKLSPDLVVLNFCMNDVLDVMDTEGRLVRGRPWIQEYPPLNHVSGLARMAAYYSDARRAKVIREKGLWTNELVYGNPNREVLSFEALYEEKTSPRVAAAWKKFFDDLTDFDRICKSAHVPWVLLSFPIRDMMPPREPAHRLVAKLRSWTAERDIDHLDVTHAFHAWISRRGESPMALFRDEVHPNPEGSRIVARTLSAFLIERGWVDAKKTRARAAD